MPPITVTNATGGPPESLRHVVCETLPGISGADSYVVTGVAFSTPFTARQASTVSFTIEYATLVSAVPSNTITGIGADGMFVASCMNSSNEAAALIIDGLSQA